MEKLKSQFFLKQKYQSFFRIKKATAAVEIENKFKCFTFINQVFGFHININ